MTKKCKDCGIEKSLEDFYGIQGECKECTKKRMKISSHNIKKKCIVCGNQFGTCQAEINRGGGKTCSRDCWYKYQKIHIKRGKNSHAWKKGKISVNGYLKIKVLGHPKSDCREYVFEHILVMEKHLKRYLLPAEKVHHIDGDKSNNKISNLMLFPTSGAHTKFHHEMRRKLKKESDEHRI
jgi:hypothetical protein